MKLNFEDLCFMDTLFEKMMLEAQKLRTKKEVIAIIRENHLFFKEQKLLSQEGLLVKY